MEVRGIAIVVSFVCLIILEKHHLPHKLFSYIGKLEIPIATKSNLMEKEKQQKKAPGQKPEQRSACYH
jgi:hypothetical protein